MRKKQKVGSRRAVKKASSVPAKRQLTDELHHRQVCEAAYYLAEKRGFWPSNELNDWLEAEKIINSNI